MRSYSCSTRWPRACPRAAGSVACLRLARLDRRLLVGADDVVAGVQPLALPAAGVQIQDRAGLLGEPWVAREDPRAVLPRLDRVLRQPPPDGHAADLLDDPAPDRLARELLRGPARERHATFGRQRARHRDHLSADVRGERPAGVRAVAGPPVRRVAARRTACATARRPRAGTAAARRSGRCAARPPPASTIWARTTCQYGNVYDRANDSNTARSSSLSSIRYGLRRGINAPSRDDRMPRTVRRGRTTNTCGYLRATST